MLGSLCQRMSEAHKPYVTLDWYQPEVDVEAFTERRREAAQRVEYWAGRQKNAAAAKDFDLARFASEEAKIAKRDVRILNELKAALFPDTNGRLPRKIWPVEEAAVVGHHSAMIRFL